MAHLPMRFYSRVASRNPNVVFMEPGGDSVQTNSNNNGFYAGFPDPKIVLVTTNAVTGSRCIGFNAGAGSLQSKGFFHNPLRGALGGCRINFYVRFSGLVPSINKFDYIFFSTDDGSGSAVYGISLGTDNTIKIWDNYGTIPNTGARQIGGDNAKSAAISINTWYRICVCNNMYGYGRSNAMKAYLDGSLFVNSYNHEHSGGLILPGYTQTGMPERIIFQTHGNAGAATYYDDIYVDDGESLADVGPVHITYKLPSSDFTNNFGTAIGNNPANRWTNVNEQPLNTSNGWRENSGGPYPIDENYGVQALNQGEVDLSQYVGLTLSSPAVGLRTSIPQGTDLWECGMHIAFSDSPSSIIAHMSYVRGATVATSGSTPLIFNNGAPYAVNSSSLGGNWGTTTNNSFLAHTVSLQTNKESYDAPFIFSSVAANRPFIFSSRD